MNPAKYAASHADRTNLVIHLAAVPLFWLGTLVLVTGLSAMLWLVAAQGLAGLGVSLGLQGLGHRREQVPPEPFASPLDFLTRIFVEQFFRFPAFVASGGWWRNFRRT